MEKKELTAEEIEKLDKMWDENKERVESDHEGQYIVFDDNEMQGSGISRTNFKAPGNMTTGVPRRRSKGYFLKRYGKDRFKLFRRG